jgi:hypothetical protein
VPGEKMFEKVTSYFAPKREQSLSAKMTIGDVPQTVLLLAVAGLIGAFTVNIVSNIGTGFTAGSLERNITTQVNTGFSRLYDYWDEIGLVVAAVIMITLLVRGFGGVGSVR